MSDRWPAARKLILRLARIRYVIGAGLMLAGEPDKFERPTLIITKAGRAYLDQHRVMVAFDG